MLLRHEMMIKSSYTSPLVTNQTIFTHNADKMLLASHVLGMQSHFCKITSGYDKKSSIRYFQYLADLSMVVCGFLHLLLFHSCFSSGFGAPGWCAWASLCSADGSCGCRSVRWCHVSRLVARLHHPECFKWRPFPCSNDRHIGFRKHMQTARHIQDVQKCTSMHVHEWV